MNVLHLTLSYSNGGRREAIATLAEGLSGLGVGNHLGCLEEFGCEPDKRATFAGSFSLCRKGLFDLGALRRIGAYCREHAIDVVHAHDAARRLDTGIVAARWMTREALQDDPQRLRSPLVIRCIDDCLAGVRHDLSALHYLDAQPVPAGA